MPKNPRKMGKMMAFDTRGSVQTIITVKRSLRKKVIIGITMKMAK